MSPPPIITKVYLPPIITKVKSSGSAVLNILLIIYINIIGGLPDYMDMQSTNSEIMLRNSLPKMMDPPVNFSWVDAGAVTPAKDQASITKITKVLTIS